MIPIEDMPWWQREKLLTEKDKEAISEARRSRWEDIEEERADTEAGRIEIRYIQLRKMHAAEARCGMI